MWVRASLFRVLSFVFALGCNVYDPTIAPPSGDDGGGGATGTGLVTGPLGGGGTATGSAGSGIAGAGLGGAGTGGTGTNGVGGAGGSTVAAGVGGGGGAGRDAGLGGGGAGGRSAGGSGGASGTAGASGAGSSGGRDAGSAGAPCPTGIVISGEISTALHGGSNSMDVHFKDVCPLGGPVIGYTGSVDTTSPTSIGKIATVCGKLAVNSSGGSCKVTVSAGATLPMRGTVGDVPFMQMCPANQVVVAFQGQSGSYVDQVAFTCAPLVISSGPMGYALSLGPTTTLPSVGGNGGGPFQDGCAAGEIVHGTNVATLSNIVDAAGLICGAVSLVGP
jgi:hypothetical protein